MTLNCTRKLRVEDDRVVNSGTQAIQISFLPTLIISNVYAKVIFHFQKKKKSHLVLTTQVKNITEMILCFDLRNMILKIRVGMHVPLQTDFSTECLSDLLEGERGRKRRGKREKGRKIWRERVGGRKKVTKRERECDCATAQWPKNTKNTSPTALTYLFYIAAKSSSSLWCSSAWSYPSMHCWTYLGTVWTVSQFLCMFFSMKCVGVWCWVLPFRKEWAVWPRSPVVLLISMSECVPAVYSERVDHNGVEHTTESIFKWKLICCISAACKALC